MLNPGPRDRVEYDRNRRRFWRVGSHGFSTPTQCLLATRYRMIRRRLALLLVAAGCVYAGTAMTAAAQDAPPIPEGFTAYLIQGEGINAPPISLKVEDDRITSPPDGL